MMPAPFHMESSSRCAQTESTYNLHTPMRLRLSSFARHLLAECSAPSHFPSDSSCRTPAILALRAMSVPGRSYPVAIVPFMRPSAPLGRYSCATPPHPSSPNHSEARPSHARRQPPPSARTLDPPARITHPKADVVRSTTTHYGPSPQSSPSLARRLLAFEIAAWSSPTERSRTLGARGRNNAAMPSGSNPSL